MKKKSAFFLIATLLGLLVLPVEAQKHNKMSKAQKKQEKAEKSYNRAYARARRLTLKHRRDIQTQETRDRMDEIHKRARKNNKTNDPPFLERVFRRKKPKKH